MGMFDAEVPQTLTPIQQLQVSSQRLGDVFAPVVEKATGYISPKREMQRVASQTDLSNSKEVEKTYNFLLSKNPKAANEWLKSVKPTLDYHRSQQEGGRTIKPEEAHLNAVRAKFMKDLGPVEGEKAFGEYLKEFKVQYTGNVPSGYKMKTLPSGESVMYAVPGGPEAQKEAAASQALKDSRLYASEQASAFVRDAKYLEKFVTDNDKEFNPIFGITGKAAGIVPGSNRTDAEEMVTRLYASIGFDRLQRMRDMSPTGGALGQVSELELKQLNKSMGSLSLDQSPEQFKRNLNIVIEQYSKIMKKIAETGDGTYFSTSNVLSTVNKNNNAFNF